MVLSSESLYTQLEHSLRVSCGSVGSNGHKSNLSFVNHLLSSVPKIGVTNGLAIHI